MSQRRSGDARSRWQPVFSHSVFHLGHRPEGECPPRSFGTRKCLGSSKAIIESKNPATSGFWSRITTLSTELNSAGCRLACRTSARRVGEVSPL